MENNKFISYIDEIAVTDESSKKITIDNLNLRKSSSTKDDIILTIPKGAEVEIIPENKGWSLIKYKDTIGFVYNKYLADKKNEQTIKKYVNVATLNFRSGPSTSYSIISTLSKGTKVEVISTTNNWSKIIYDGKIGYVSSEYLSKSIDLNDKTSTLETTDKIISYAKGLLGKKYVWADEGPDTFDCSGFTWYVYKNVAKISIPRTSKDQGVYGTYVSIKNLKPADLVFFDTVGVKDNIISHVGIYIGNNQFIHASSSKGKVVISNLENYYLDRFVNGRRILK
jgi:cell wall-associated NlpC family hydrolase